MLLSRVRDGVWSPWKLHSDQGADGANAPEWLSTTAIALDEIDFRGLLGRIAESRFHRIAMSLGDGLVCTDEGQLIAVWNPGASAIFGYMPAEIIGRPFETLCAVSVDGDARPSMRDAARRL